MRLQVDSATRADAHQSCRAKCVEVLCGVKTKTMRPLSAEQFFVTLAGSCLFPFAAPPMMSEALGLGSNAHQAFMERRRTELLAFFKRALHASDAPASPRCRRWVLRRVRQPRPPTYQGYVEGEFVHVAAATGGRLERPFVPARLALPRKREYAASVHTDDARTSSTSTPRRGVSARVRSRTAKGILARRSGPTSAGIRHGGNGGRVRHVSLVNRAM